MLDNDSILKPKNKRIFVPALGEAENLNQGVSPAAQEVRQHQAPLSNSNAQKVSRPQLQPELTRGNVINQLWLGGKNEKQAENWPWFLVRGDNWGKECGQGALGHVDRPRSPSVGSSPWYLWAPTGSAVTIQGHDGACWDGEMHKRLRSHHIIVSLPRDSGINISTSNIFLLALGCDSCAQLTFIKWLLMSGLGWFVSFDSAENTLMSVSLNSFYMRKLRHRNFKLTYLRA